MLPELCRALPSLRGCQLEKHGPVRQYVYISITKFTKDAYDQRVRATMPTSYSPLLALAGSNRLRIGFRVPLLRSPGDACTLCGPFFLDLGWPWGRSGVAFWSILHSTGRSHEKRPTLTKHCACAVRQASDLPRTTQKSLANPCGSLMRNALRKGRSKKWSRGLPSASWNRFGRLRDAPGAPGETPDELRGPSGRLPGAPWVVPGRPEMVQGLPRATLDRFCVDLGSIWVNAASIAPTKAPTNAPTSRLAKKKTICITTILHRRCLLRALWNDASCLKSSIYIHI